MLTKHSITYFLGRGLPGLINFIGLSIYTRFVQPEAYGNYALVVTTVNLFNAVLFQWIRLVLLRFTPACESESDKARLNSTVIVGYAGATSVSIFLLLIWFLFSGEKMSLPYIALGISLLISQALFEIGLDYYRSNLNPRQYSIASFVKALSSILLSASLAYLGFGAAGLLAGLLGGTTLAVIFYFTSFLKELRTGLQQFDWQLIRKHLEYGVPLTASSALTFVMDSSDRYLVKLYLGVAATGAYSVGYDLSKQTLWVIMSAISLASYPLVIRALEKEGHRAANKHLAANLIMLLAVSVPTAVGMSVLAPEIATLLVGNEYAEIASLLIPYIVIGALLSGLKSFYLDQSFQLAQKTRLQLWSVGIAALLNVGMNIILLPRIGLMGAAYSTLLSYGIVLIISYVLSQQAYKLPMPWGKIGRIGFAALIMGAIILLVKPYCYGLLGFIFLVTLGAGVYGSLLVALNVISSSDLVNRLKLKRKLKNYA